MLVRNLTSFGMSINGYSIRNIIQWTWRVIFWQDKMDLIDKMRKEALGEGEEE